MLDEREYLSIAKQIPSTSEFELFELKGKQTTLPCPLGKHGWSSVHMKFVFHSLCSSNNLNENQSVLAKFGPNLNLKHFTRNEEFKSKLQSVKLI